MNTWSVQNDKELSVIDWSDGIVSSLYQKHWTVNIKFYSLYNSNAKVWNYVVHFFTCLFPHNSPLLQDIIIILLYQESELCIM